MKLIAYLGSSFLFFTNGQIDRDYGRWKTLILSTHVQNSPQKKYAFFWLKVRLKLTLKIEHSENLLPFRLSRSLVNTSWKNLLTCVFGFLCRKSLYQKSRFSASIAERQSTKFFGIENRLSLIGSNNSMIRQKQKVPFIKWNGA